MPIKTKKGRRLRLGLKMVRFSKIGYFEDRKMNLGPPDKKNYPKFHFPFFICLLFCGCVCVVFGSDARAWVRWSLLACLFMCVSVWYRYTVPPEGMRWHKNEKNCIKIRGFEDSVRLSLIHI